MLGAYLANYTSHLLFKYLLTVIVIIACVGLAAHLFPGFNNLLVLDKVSKSTESSAFSLYLNFDKPMILFALLLMFPSLLNTYNSGKKLHPVGGVSLALFIVFM